MSSERKSILLTCSDKFKDAVGEYAAQHKTDVNKVIREAVANYIGYDLSQDVTVLGRRRKYATDEERKEAQKEKRLSDARLKKALIELYNHNEHVQNMVALERSLERKNK